MGRLTANSGSRGLACTRLAHFDVFQFADHVVETILRQSILILFKYQYHNDDTTGLRPSSIGQKLLAFIYIFSYTGRGLDLCILELSTLPRTYPRVREVGSA